MPKQDFFYGTPIYPIDLPPAVAFAHSNGVTVTFHLKVGGGLQIGPVKAPFVDRGLYLRPEDVENFSTGTQACDLGKPHPDPQALKDELNALGSKPKRGGRPKKS